MEWVWPYSDLKGWMMCENRDRLCSFGVDHVHQVPHTLAAKVALVAVGAQGIQRYQSDRMILNRILDKFGIETRAYDVRKGFAQLFPVVFVACQNINGRAQASERCHCSGVFITPSVMSNIPGVDDHIGGGIERVNVRNGAFKIAYSPIGIGSIQRDVSVGNLSDNHGPELLDRSPA